MTADARVPCHAPLRAAGLGRAASALLLPAVLLAAQCGRPEPAPGASSPTATSPPAQAAATGGVRFVMRVPAAVPTPVYVQVGGTNHQPGWITVLRGEEPIFLLERCDVETCGRAAAVCGAAIPMVRDLAAGSRTIDLRWDGTTSVLDPTAQCQTRRAAPAGPYIARFCWGHSVTLMGGGGAGPDRAGEVVAPVCRDVPFELPRDGEVAVDVPPG